MKRSSLLFFLAFFSISSLYGVNYVEKAKNNGLKAIPNDQSELHKLIDNPNNLINEDKIELGKMLYFEPRLSKSGLISCNTCHNLATGGVDKVPAAIGHRWTANPHHLNSPTVYNAVFNATQFWDGRSPDLEDQAQGPIQAEPEMAMSKERAVEVISSMDDYKIMFKKAFGENEVTFKKIADAIAVFERTLVTPSKFDRFLNGDENALNKAEKVGLNTFIDKGCVSCHNGIGIGNGTLQSFPIVMPFKYAEVGDFFKGKKSVVVKVPTLRNIAETAPYFHNGTVWDLKEAIAIMGETQLGQKFTQKEIDSIYLFLNTLTGDKPKIKYPNLPKRSENTPKPIF
jgi:cytochrome c peroxidase